MNFLKMTSFFHHKIELFRKIKLIKKRVGNGTVHSENLESFLEVIFFFKDFFYAFLINVITPIYFLILLNSNVTKTNPLELFGLSSHDSDLIDVSFHLSCFNLTIFIIYSQG